MGLTKRKDSYYVQFSVLDDGTTLTLARGAPGAKLKRWKVGCRNKDEAVKQEGIIKTKLLEGMRLTPDIPVAPILIRDFVQRWLVNAKGSLAAKTYVNYAQILRLYVLPSLGDRSLRALSWADVKGLLHEKQQAGLSVNTVRLIRAVISSILTDAAEDQVITANPVLGQRRKRRASQTVALDVCPFTWEQKRAFEHSLLEMEREDRLSPSYCMLLSLLLKTGLRPGEGRALKVGDIDFHGRRLRVERAATLEGAIKGTKTGGTRWVDLSDGLLEQLKTYVTLLRAEDVARGKESKWLFPSLTGTLLEERHVVRAFHRVLERAGLPRFRVYDLRHTFASLLLSSNIPLPYVSQQLGHSKPMITLKYYTRWIPSGQVHRVNVLDVADTVLTLASTPREAAASLPA
jgi:integrase